MQIFFSLTLIVASTCMLVSNATAGSVEHDYFINAAGNCQGALPSYEGALRKRPTAISNEGGSVAFVTCSLPGSSLPTVNFNNELSIGFNNHNSADVNVTCTFVDGLAAPYNDNFEGPDFYPQVALIPRNSFAGMIWSSEETGVLFSSTANISCALPPGVEINWLRAVSQPPAN